MEQLIALLTALISEASAVSTLIDTVRSEGRDVSEEELDELMGRMHTSRADALAAIEEARQS